MGFDVGGSILMTFVRSGIYYAGSAAAAVFRDVFLDCVPRKGGSTRDAKISEEMAVWCLAASFAMAFSCTVSRRAAKLVITTTMRRVGISAVCLVSVTVIASVVPTYALAFAICGRRYSCKPFS